MSENRSGAPTDSDPDRTDEPVRAHYEWESTPPSTAVVETVAKATGSEPTSLGPLYDSLDPDALNALVASIPPSAVGRDICISLALDGHRVTIYGDGEVVVRTGATRV
ncbi:HalOD1 output domain-containing protein [Halobellus rarus]|uniref:HalOD1 output domain-containing protein n=1 Tax=Halobellus rarus TaxID=1126237 RepID=A0ABD6CMF0_9EURY|nr:HalOD1 output domain-containing protein [Halobellus rarus]